MIKRGHSIFSMKKELKQHTIRVKAGRNVIEESHLLEANHDTTFQFDENREGKTIFRPEYEMVEVEFLCSSNAALSETKKKALEKTLETLEKEEEAFLKMIQELKEKTGLRTGHEYILIYYKSNFESISYQEKSTGDLNLKDKFGKYRKGRELMKWGGTSLREDRPQQFYKLLCPEGYGVEPYRNDGKEGHIEHLFGRFSLSYWLSDF